MTNIWTGLNVCFPIVSKESSQRLFATPCRDAIAKTLIPFSTHELLESSFLERLQPF